VHFINVEIDTHDGQHFFHVDIAPGAIAPDRLKVELYADSAHGQGISCQAMKAIGPSADTPGAFTYSAQVAATRPASDYTARIVPYHLNAVVPLEANQIVWQR
jgi:starch phosphorylase